MNTKSTATIATLVLLPIAAFSQPNPPNPPPGPPPIGPVGPGNDRDRHEKKVPVTYLGVETDGVPRVVSEQLGLGRKRNPRQIGETGNILPGQTGLAELLGIEPIGWQHLV